MQEVVKQFMSGPTRLKRALTVTLSLKQQVKQPGTDNNSANISAETARGFGLQLFLDFKPSNFHPSYHLFSFLFQSIICSPLYVTQCQYPFTDLEAIAL